MGDLSTLWELEQGLLRQPVPAAINRAACYMSNWDAMIDAARNSGTLSTMLPADTRLPMVSPDDLGRIAADRLLSAPDDAGLAFVEGPERYSPRALAAILSGEFGSDVALDVVPGERTEGAFREMGFTPESARSYARMIAITATSAFDVPQEPLRGRITFGDHVRDVLGSRASDNAAGD